MAGKTVLEDPGLLLQGSLLQDQDTFYSSLPFEYLFVGHCLLIASWFPRLKNRFLASYWVSLLAALGGGLLSSLLLQLPKQAPLAIFASNQVGVIWTVCWWLVNYSPFDAVATLVNLLPVRLVLKCCSNVLRATLVTERVDLCVVAYPGVIMAPLFMGALGGSGGAFAIGPLLAGLGEVRADETELLRPSFAARSAFAGALAQYLLVHIFGLLSAPEGRALVISAYVLHGIASDLLGQTLDWTYPLAWLAHTAANVPMPDARRVALLESRPRAAGGGAKGLAAPAESASVATTAAVQPEAKKAESKSEAKRVETKKGK